MKPKILITGGAGYIGSHFLKLALEQDWDIYVLDNLSTGNKKAILGGKFIQADLNNHEEIQNVLKKIKPDIVAHFAALIIVPESVTEPNKYYRNNVIGTLNLLNAMKEAGTKNIIFSSTAAVYGDPEYVPINEKHPLAPLNPYGKSKMFMEEIIKDFSSAYNMNYLIFRYFNVAGASPDKEIGHSPKKVTHLITRAIKTATGEYDKIYLFGTDYPTKDGTAERDYIHVMDLAQAHILGANHLLSNGKSDILNLGYGIPYTVKEVIEATKKVTGVDFIVEEADRRPGDASSLYADSTKAKKLLNWKPKYDDLEFIIKTAWEWEQNKAY